MNKTAVEIREIRPEELYPIRQQLLRPGRPIEEVHFEGDTSSDTFHLGAFHNNSLVGIATFVKKDHPDLQFPKQYQLRGMAVLPEVQKKHVGQQLLQEGESRLKQRDIGLLWFNARETAINFYTKNGYQTHGGLFEIPLVCMHIVMFKILKESSPTFTHPNLKKKT